jgi:26S proteasome regulatory subunit N2
MACCAGLKAARKLLEPMLKDTCDFVREGAAMATALVLLQQPEAEVSDFRKHLDATICDKHEDNVSKMGAILASGILDAGALMPLLLLCMFATSLLLIGVDGHRVDSVRYVR